MRRLALLAAMILGSGTIASVAVSWVGISLQRPALGDNRWVDWTGRNTDGRNGWTIREWRDDVLTMRRLEPWSSEWGAERDPGYEPPPFSLAWTEAQADLQTRESPYMEQPASAVEKEAGWPLRCLRVRWELTRPAALPDEVIRGGLQSESVRWGLAPTSLLGQPDFSYVEAERLCALPLVPIWRGLLINTLCFAAAFALLVVPGVAPGMIRALVRRRRGACVRCGYDLRAVESDRCPECGWVRGRRTPLVGRATVALAMAVLLANASFLAWFGVRRCAAAERVPRIHRAAALGDVRAIKAEVARGVSASTPLPDRVDLPMMSFDLDASTPLTWAAARGQVEAIEALVGAGADPDLAVGWGLPPLSAAVRYGQPEACEALLRAGADPALQGEHRASPLEEATRTGDTRLIAMLRSAVSREAALPASALAGAVRGGAEGLRDLLGSFEWEQDALARALVAAAQIGGHDQTVQLLEQDAPVSDATLFAGVKGNSVEVVSLLIGAGADVRVSEHPLLWEAAELANAEMIGLLLEHGADTEIDRGFPGWTPLRRTIIRECREGFDRLLEAGANARSTNEDGVTLLHEAVSCSSHTHFMEALIERGIAVDSPDNAGMTPLMHAIAEGRRGAVELLLARGADPSATDRSGRSSLDYARGGVSFTIGYWTGATEPRPDILQLLRGASDDPG